MNARTSIAHYRLTGKLGQGGMGEVYRATDTKLWREVAIKILPESFAEDSERLARLTREAEVLASLNHPNIAAIYGVEEGALVIELVEGPTIEERLMAGPIAVKEALAIARQIAEAIEYAHGKGVLHRDLKPANIKFSELSGTTRVKVLDFGLATVSTAASPPGSDPTIALETLRTAVGAIEGTPGYMSPEQARGQRLDKRADIWAFGVILFEMLTGQRLFSGDTVSDTLAAVLRAEINWPALPPGIPAAIRRLLRRCLERDRERRLADMGDARLEIDEAMEEPAEPVAAPAVRPPRIWKAAAGVLAAALAVSSWVIWRDTRPADLPLQRFDIGFDPPSLKYPVHTLSPDGSRLVFVGRDPDGSIRLHVRLLDQGASLPLVGTEDARDPFFSPDGQWVAFGSGGTLKKTLVQGGIPVRICDCPDLRGGSWGDDGYIVFAPGNRSALVRVAAAGGIPQPFTTLENGEISHRHPQVLPGAQAVLYSASTQTDDYDDSTIRIRFLKSGQTRTVRRGGFYARFLQGGYLAWVYKGQIYAAPMDPARGELRGEAFPILDNLAADPTRGVGHFAAASSGLFAAITGIEVRKYTVEWLDASGHATPVPAPPAEYNRLQFSPDGKRVALDVSHDGKSDILIYDVEQARLSTLTFGGDGRYPVWTPDGKHLVFLMTDRTNQLAWVRADGSRPPEILLGRHEGISPVEPNCFTPDGKRLLFTASAPQSARAIWMLPLDSSSSEHPVAGKPEPLLHSRGPEESPAISPDGRWLAYTLGETGGAQRLIFVQPFSATGGKWAVSDGGASHPMWSQSGHDLFYLSDEGRIMAVTYRVEGASFVPSRPRVWAEAAVPVSGGWYDMTPDGKRAMVIRPNDQMERVTHRLTFLVNLPDELRRRTVK